VYSTVTLALPNLAGVLISYDATRTPACELTGGDRPNGSMSKMLSNNVKIYTQIFHRIGREEKCLHTWETHRARKPDALSPI